jgi:drug/metabolite transporter (DMT)-like permease
MKPFISYALVACCVLMISTGQILFKIIGGRLSGAITADHITLNYSTVGLLTLAFGIYGLGTILWIVALTSLPLARAYMFMAAAFILVPLAANLFLGEALPPRLLIGAAIISLGTWVAVTR